MSDDEFISAFTRFLRDVVERQRAEPPRRTPLGDAVSEHIGQDASTLPVVSESVPGHRLVDADIALDLLTGETGRVLGVSGGQQRQHESFTELLTSPYASFDVGPVDYGSAPIGPDAHRRIVSFGVRLLRHGDAPIAVLQRGPAPEYGRELAALDVIAPDPDAATAFLSELRRLMRENSVLRGQVLTFTGSGFGSPVASSVFLPRPDVAADDVILAPGTLERISAHVLGIGRQRERLRLAGQHLKRGVLLYGPPGTGKTLTVRHLLGRADDTTCVLLTGAALGFITEAAELARSLQPAIVVLEDVDLVAADRDMYGGPQPLLFSVLDALDGLDGDADVAFVLTTNRADILEEALAQRPGRIDLAVEVPLPDAAARRRLFGLYGGGLPFGDAALDAAAEASEGTTGSFAKEAVRRAVLRAAAEDREPGDGDLSAVLEEMSSDLERLTRSLLGGEREGVDGFGDGFGDDAFGDDE